MPSDSLDVRDLIRKSSSPYVGERAEAMERIQRMGPAEQMEVLRFLEGQTARFARRKRAFRWIATGVSLVCLPLTAVCVYNGIVYNPGWFGALGGILGGGFGGGVGGSSFLLVPPPELRAAAALLANFDEPAVAAPLLLTLSAPTTSPDVRYETGRALCRVLSRITEENAGLLTREHRLAALQYLKRSVPEKEEELLTAMLHMLAVAGGPEAVQPLRSLAARLSFGAGERIAEEAARTLAAVEERLERLKSGEGLLRPSSPAALGEETLLRAARSGEGTETGQLLRPIEGGENGEAAAQAATLGQSPG
jgi:hypothetical protein